MEHAPSGESRGSGRIRLYSRDGELTRELRSRLTNPRSAEWGRSEWLAVRDYQEGTELVHAAGVEPSVMIPGWLALAMSPDGKTLLLRSLDKGNRIGIVNVPEADVTVLGELPGDNLFPGAWVEGD